MDDAIGWGKYYGHVLLVGKNRLHNIYLRTEGTFWEQKAGRGEGHGRFVSIWCPLA